MREQPTLKDRKRTIRNESILDSAETLFAEKGFGVVRFEEIASAACISRPTLYSHFRSKEDVAVAIAVRYIGKVVDFIGSLDPSSPPLERLRQVIEWAAEFRFGSNAGFVHSLTQYVVPLHQTDPRLEAAETRLIELLSALIGECQSAGVVRDDVESQFLAGLMLSSQHGYLGNLLVSGRLTVAEIVGAWNALLRR